MSSDAFVPVAFPRLQGRQLDAEAARARMRGYADGHAEGFRAGVAEAAATAAEAEARRDEADARAAADLASALSALATATDALIARVRELSAAAEEKVCAQSIELAETIIAESLADRESAAVAALGRAMAAQRADAVGEIRLSPADLRTLALRGAVPERVTVVADESLAPGDAVALVGDSLIDARISAALERARQALTEVAP